MAICSNPNCSNEDVRCTKCGYQPICHKCYKNVVERTWLSIGLSLAITAVCGVIFHLFKAFGTEVAVLFGFFLFTMFAIYIVSANGFSNKK